jgi:hypothetical protein
MSTIHPIGYASSGLVHPRRDPLVVVVVVLNCCIAIVGIFYSGIFALQSYGEVERAHHDAISFQQGYARRQATYAAILNAPAWTPPASYKPTSAPSSFRALTPPEISDALNLVLRRLDSSHLSPHLSPAQIKTLTKLLSTTPQKLIDPTIPLGSEISGHLQIVRPFLSNDGSLTVTINRGSPANLSRICLDAAGQEVPTRSVFTPTPGPPPIAYNLPPLPQPAVILQQYSGQARAAMWSTTRYGVSLVLDLLLLVAAVFLLNSSRKGIWLLWLYVVLKLSIVAVEGTPLMTMLAGDGDASLFGKVPIVASAIYPAALIVILRQRIFRSPSLIHQDSTESSSIAHRSWKIVSILSLVYATISLLLIGFVLSEAMYQLSQAPREAAGTNMDQPDYQSSLAVVCALVFMLILATLLLAGAILLLLRKRPGVLLHRIYAVLEIPASLVLGGIVIWAVTTSPAGMIAWIFAFPALIGCIYPIVILTTLRDRKPAI